MSDREPEYVYPSKRAIYTFWALLALFIAIAFSLQLIIDYLSPKTTDHLSLLQLQASADWYNRVFIFECIAGAFIFGGLGIWHFLYGYRITKFSKFPPPDGFVLMKTKIRRGAESRNYAIYYYAVAMLSVMWTIACIYFAWDALHDI